MTDRATKIQRAKQAKTVGVGLQTLSIINDASATKADLSAQTHALSIFQDETDRRHSIQVTQLRKQASRAVSGQTETFIKAGVKMEGSALDVVNDTYFDLLEAELEAETERAFAEEQLRVKQAGLRVQRKGVATQAAISAGATILGGMG